MTSTSASAGIVMAEEQVYHVDGVILAFQGALNLGIGIFTARFRVVFTMTCQEIYNFLFRAD